MTPLFKVFMPKEINNELNELLYSGSLAGGVYQQNFENNLKEFLGNEKLLTLSGNSVFFALKLLDIKENDEVIISPMACLATTQPISYCGAKVVWADIDPKTGTLSPDDVKKKITYKTKAIIHYHWCGYPGYIDEINNIAKEHNIYVIEDAIEAFGAKYKNNYIGNTNSDIVCFSFTPVRLPNTIDGGAITFQNSKLYEKAKLKRDFGINRSLFRNENGEISESFDVELTGLGNTLNNLSSFIGLKQMNSLPGILDKYRKNARKWYSLIEQSDEVEGLNTRDEIEPSFWCFTLLSRDRDNLLIKIREKGFYASKVHVRNDIYSVFKNKNSSLPGVDNFAKHQINLPCGWWIDESMITSEIFQN